ncbi:MAG: methylmalonyl-CoA mutase family protein, partial [Pedobacter sp.]|nr:methylmalonyl-CoA mutase family protein [Pedobacter sp.]
EVEAGAWAYIDKIEAMGGSISAIESGYMQNEIANASYQYQTDVEKRERIIVGVNHFVQEEPEDTEVLKIDDSIRKIQTEKLKLLKAERDNNEVAQALNNLKEGAKTDQNLMPLIIHAVEKYATLGEIADRLREVFGEY